MRIRAALVLLAVLAAPPAAAVAQPFDLAKLSWLAGGWRTEGARFTTEEHWIADAGGMMLGVSRSVSGGKAVGFEFLRVVSRDGALVYVAQPGGRPPTEFTCTALTGESATFENPGHDHPKLLRYTLTEDGALRIDIQGDEGSQSFEMKRLDAPGPPR